MPRDVSGTYVPPTGTEAVPGAIASSSAFNELIDDIADELTASLTRDGSATWSGNQNAGTHKVTNLGTPSAATDAATKAYVDGAAGASAKLSAIDALTWAADKLMYFTGTATASTVNFLAFGRSLVAAVDAAAGRAVLLLGDLATQDTVNNGDWSGADLSVANGGTGASDAATARVNLGIDPYAGTDADYDAFSVGSYVLCNSNSTAPARNATVVPRLNTGNAAGFTVAGSGNALDGTWHSRGTIGDNLLCQRIA